MGGWVGVGVVGEGEGWGEGDGGGLGGGVFCLFTVSETLACSPSRQFI